MTLSHRKLPRETKEIKIPTGIIKIRTQATLINKTVKYCYTSFIYASIFFQKMQHETQIQECSQIER